MEFVGPNVMTGKCGTGKRRTKCHGWEMWDRKMQVWKMKECGCFTRNVVSVLCISHCILSNKLFSGNLQINLIAILFYCDFHVLSVLWMTSCFHTIDLWQVMYS